MSSKRTELTQERLHQLLNYDRETGLFTNKVQRGPAPAGQAAGCVQQKNGNNYKRWQIVIDRRHYKAHHLAWFYVYGYWPTMLDHVDRNGLNNRIDNLREANSANNGANSKHPKGATGYRGVSYYKNRYMAQISHKGRSLYLGRFKTADEAYKAWCAAAIKLRGEFARTD